MKTPEPTSRSYKLVPFFEDTLADAREVLNFGSGDGYLSHYLEARPRAQGRLAITDVDVQDHSTTGRTPILFDGARLPFTDGHFDATLCMYVLHHTPDPDPLIAEIRRVTRRTVIVTEDLVSGRGLRADAIVREVMVPRTDMITISASDDTDRALDVALACGRSRIPVTGDDLDDIVGVSHSCRVN